MFMTIEDETGVANIVVWPSLFEKQPRVVLGPAMMAINGKIQREGGVVHLSRNGCSICPPIWQALASGMVSG